MVAWRTAPSLRCPGRSMSAKFLCKRIPAGKIEKYPSIAAASEAARQLAFRCVLRRRRRCHAWCSHAPLAFDDLQAAWPFLRHDAVSHMGWQFARRRGPCRQCVPRAVLCSVPCRAASHRSAGPCADAVQQRSAALLKAAYSNISTKAAASKLGLSEADTCTLLQAQGWKLDSRSGMLSAEGGAGTTSAAPEADIDTVTQALEGLLSSAVALEQPPVQAALLG